MSTAALFLAITLASTIIATISASLLSCISCPCGSGSRNYTHCIDESLSKEFTCDRWLHCQTCKANTTFCITCPKDRLGPTCSQILDGHKRRKRQVVPDIFKHPRYPRQSGSERHSQTWCLNPGVISNGRVIVILPFHGSNQPSEDDDDFEFPYGTRLKYTCDDGFVLKGKDTLRCVDSFWTESIPECVGETPVSQETCKHPGVDVNGRINNPLIDPRRRRRPQVFPVGTELTFVCNEGFEPEGATVIACLSNGKWTSLPPKCRSNPTSEVIELPCRHPGMVINGMFNGDLYKSSFPVGTALTFRCIEGTERKGPMTIFCLRDGRWSEPPPTCEPTRNGRQNSSSYFLEFERY